MEGWKTALVATVLLVVAWSGGFSRREEESVQAKVGCPQAAVRGPLPPCAAGAAGLGRFRQLLRVQVAPAPARSPVEALQARSLGKVLISVCQS